MKKVQLERILQSLEPLPSPRPNMEQYPTPAGIAAEVAFIAFAKGDLADRRVLDAGCGNGILAIAASLLGAAETVGVDVDPAAIQVARRNARLAGADVIWQCSDIGEVKRPFDTVLMNPPFGSQRRHADRPFVDKALEVGSVIYSFHNQVAEEFTSRRIESRGGRITERVRYAFPLARAFPFHTAEVRTVPVVLFRTEVAKG